METQSTKGRQPCQELREDALLGGGRTSTSRKCAGHGWAPRTSWASTPGQVTEGLGSSSFSSLGKLDNSLSFMIVLRVE